MKKLLILTRFPPEYEPQRLAEEAKKKEIKPEIVHYQKAGDLNLNHFTWVIPRSAAHRHKKSLLSTKMAVIEALPKKAICLNKEGYVCEGVGENIFLVTAGKLFTPPISSGALDGITRAFIMRAAEALGYTIQEKNITLNELFNADEVFFTGTAAEVTPIRKINDRVIGKGRPGPVTTRLRKEFYTAIKNPKEGTPIN